MQVSFHASEASLLQNSCQKTWALDGAGQRWLTCHLKRSDSLCPDCFSSGE